MQFQDEDPIYFKSNYILDDETQQKFSELIKRARNTTSKEQARRLLKRADSLAYRGYIAQLEMIGEF